MNIPAKNRHLKSIALLMFVLSTLLYAAAVFLPTTQPPVILGKYVLQNADLLSQGTIAYRPWFENGAWQGDIIEYEITIDGVRRTDASVEGLPASGTKGWCGRTDSGCWSARATFIDKGADISNGEYWKARNIITYNDENLVTPEVPFTWDNLSENQRKALDQTTVDSILAAQVDGEPNLNDNPYASDILNFIRGERINERRNDGYLRTRYSVLGDITNTPAYIGPPKELLSNIDSFSEFSDLHSNRRSNIASGANDGMLHIFDTTDGSEVFAYIPSMVIGKLGLLAASNESYQHAYYVDGELKASSAQIGDVWHTILTGGGGAGFAGLYALDMTDPDFDPDKDRILFEKDASDGFGYIYGKPQIVPLGNDNANPDWYIVTGNGYSTDATHPTALMMVSLDDTDTVYEITSTTNTETPDMGTGGLSAVTLLSTDKDDMPELAFAGDIKGNLWMIEINQTSPQDSTATMIYEGNIDQPITNAPSIGEHLTEQGYMIYFGTGSILSMDDALDDGMIANGNFTKKQAIHGIWVDTSNMSALKDITPHNSDNLQTQTLVEADYTTTDPDSGTTIIKSVRYVPAENPVNYRCPYSSPGCDLHKGWKLELQNCGERLVGVPFPRAGRLQFVTTNPTGLNCGERTLEGDSWVMSLDFLSGGDGNTIVYNLDGKPILDEGDAVDIDVDNNGIIDENDEKKPPVGLNLGPGNISQPAFARVDKGIDKMYINGLILAVPIPGPGPLLGGHLDVETDSPTDGVIATNEVSKHSEGYMLRTGKNDGLGKAVDGHIHDYDGMHGVNYVDLFQLEPRRGKANLVATLVNAEEASCNTETANQKGKWVEGHSLELLEGELNRAYDTLHTDADGKSHGNYGEKGADDLPTPVLQSEVNSLGVDPDFEEPPPEKKFIVVLANADLSNAGVLQIGCKVWPVVEYQDMITAKLQATTDISNLKDDDGDSLIFTLAGIMSSDPTTCPGGVNAPDEEIYTREYAITKGLSDTPTLRIGFGERSILDGGIHPTRSQCVLGLHDYRETVCYTDQEVLQVADSMLPLDSANYIKYPSCTGLQAPTPPLEYLRDPKDNLHITNIEGKGFRWRNGALTLQLLDAGINPSTDLQDPDTMVSGAGTFAKAFFTADMMTFTNKKSAFEDDESGMLYETTMFWHYSTLVDKSRNEDPVKNSTPPEGGCYSGPGYSGKTVIDIGGTNPAETRKLLAPLLAECDKPVPEDGEPCELGQYLNLLQRIATAETEEELNQALIALASLLETASDALKKLHELWDYIPEDEKPNPGDLGQPKTIADGTPAQVTSIETIDLEARGPNYVYGRRNWIDLKQ